MMYIKKEEGLCVGKRLDRSIDKGTVKRFRGGNLERHGGVVGC